MIGNRLFVACMLASLGLAGCSSNPSTKYEGLSADELHARAKSLPLAERYAMYLDVYDDQTPHNPMLAWDMVELGQPVRIYAMSRVPAADAKEFGAILSLFSVFDTPCSAQEKTLLMQAARRLDAREEALDARRKWIDATCSRRLRRA